jgi:hypothetical protein
MVADRVMSRRTWKANRGEGVRQRNTLRGLKSGHLPIYRFLRHPLWLWTLTGNSYH